MNDHERSRSAIYQFEAWEPLLRLLRAENAERLAAPGGRVLGRITRSSWSVPLKQMYNDGVRRMHDILVRDGIGAVTFVMEMETTGRTRLHLLVPSEAVELGIGFNPGALVLVEGALPEPWRRLPEPTPEAVLAPSADPALVERTVCGRLPDAVGATEAEIAAAELRLGIALPEELKALYRVTRAKWSDWGGDYEASSRHSQAVRCELFDLAALYVAEAVTRECPWEHAAMEAVETRPSAAVQGLAGSPGWIAFGDNGGGDRLAVDLTPGPHGHLGQVILISHEQNIGARLVADSLTDLLLDRLAAESADVEAQAPAAKSFAYDEESLGRAVHPGLEALALDVRGGRPVGLAPLMGLPRLRSLVAHPGALADPTEIAELTGLEYLGMGSREWGDVLDADAVPEGLLAVAVSGPFDEDPLAVAGLANELLALWGRPRIAQSVVEGYLGLEGQAGTPTDK
ncbi:SMI1/KNR4 family protein [Streptomyces melanogenes]|uniref:SMI1/KNR4 family protein n=1 Tax=Streptomyces melanogenes TaxID=67326 RepID=UPI001E4A7EA2|nr:SMI1/KNR4 family protein [Streptomyces melanogenes]